MRFKIIKNITSRIIFEIDEDIILSSYRWPTTTMMIWCTCLCCNVELCRRFRPGTPRKTLQTRRPLKQRQSYFSSWISSISTPCSWWSCACAVCTGRPRRGESRKSGARSTKTTTTVRWPPTAADPTTTTTTLPKTIISPHRAYCSNPSRTTLTVRVGGPATGTNIGIAKPTINYAHQQYTYRAPAVPQVFLFGPSWPAVNSLASSVYRENCKCWAYLLVKIILTTVNLYFLVLRVRGPL